MLRRIATLLGFFAFWAGAQQPEFEVASIKPSAASDDPRTLITVLPGGGLRTARATLRVLIAMAYDPPPFQVVGPGWITTDRFDVEAKAETSSGIATGNPAPLTPAQYNNARDLLRPRLRAMLEDRFELSAHRETREQQIYALTIDKKGSRLQRVTDRFNGLHVGRNQYTGDGATLDMLAGALASQLGRPVVDRTGLGGTFDFKLEWAPEGAADTAGPSIFTAIQEQLGLKLESTRGAVEILVIDHASRPSAN
jgi:bla regulator protein blaR1